MGLVRSRSGTGPAARRAAIAAVGHAAPSRFISVATALGEAGLPGRASVIYERFFGQRSVAQIEPSDILDQMESAARESLRDDEPRRVSHIIYAHSINFPLPTDAALIYKLKQRLGAVGAKVVHLSQLNCTTGIYAIEIARQIVQRRPEAEVLVMCGELARPSGTKVITNVVVMGEAIASCLVKAEGGLVIGASSFATEGRFHESEDMAPDLHKKYENSYVDNMAATINRSLEAGGITAGDVGAVFPHNVNRLSWNGVLELSGIERDRLRAETLDEYGHCFTSDPLINLHRSISDGRGVPDRSLLCASGVGATFGSMVLERA